jgi:hypothetical protein
VPARSVNQEGRAIRAQRAKPGNNPRRPRRLFTLRTVVVVELAALIALGGAGLLFAAHRAVPLIIFAAVGIFGAGLKVINDLIE